MVFMIAWWIKEKVYSMPFVFVIIALVYVYTSKKEPILEEKNITDLWIQIWEKFIPYSDIDSFWVIYFDDWNLLYIKTNAKITSTVTVPVISWDTAIIRNIFLEYWLEEIQWKKESLDDIMVRKFKL